MGLSLWAPAVLCAFASGAALAEGGVAEPRPDLGAGARPVETGAPGPTAVTLSLRGLLTVAGSVRSDLAGPMIASLGPDGVTQTRSLEPNRPVRSGLGPSPGVELHLDVPLAHYFSLGPLLRVCSWRSDVVEADGRSQATSFEVLVTPRLRAPLVVGQRPWVIYVQAPVGIGFDDIPEPTGLPEGMGGGPSWVVGLGAGVQALLFDHLGFELAFDWMHKFLEAASADTHVMGDLVSTGIGTHHLQLSSLVLKPGVLVVF